MGSDEVSVGKEPSVKMTVVSGLESSSAILAFNVST